MERRAYLSVLAGLGLAGCSGSQPATTTGPTTARTSTATTSTTTRTSTATTSTTATTTTETATTTETTETTTTTEETTTETTSEAEGYAKRRISEARADLDSAFTAYLQVAGESNDDPLAVTMDDGTFDPTTVTSPAGEAQIHLTEAEHQEVASLQSTIGDLQTVEDIFRRLAQAQAAVNVCFGTYRRARAQLFDGDVYNLQRTVETIAEDLDAAETAIARFRDLNTAATSATELTSPSTMREKGQQLYDAMSACKFFHTQYGDLVEPLRNIEDGLETYDRGDNGEASRLFDDAGDGFDDVLDEIVDRDLPGAFDGEVEGFECVLDALVEGCDELESMATAMADGNEETAEAYRTDAREAFEECETVEEEFAVLSSL